MNLTRCLSRRRVDALVGSHTIDLNLAGTSPPHLINLTPTPTIKHHSGATGNNFKEAAMDEIIE